MAAQADRLLIHSDFICKNRSFGQDAAFIDGCGFQDLTHLVFQAGAVFSHSNGAAGFHLFHQLQNGLGAAAQVIGQSDTLGSTHGIISLQRLVHNAQQVSAQLIFISLCLLHDKNIRKTGQTGDTDVITHLIIVGDLFHCRQVAFQYRAVQGDLHRLAGRYRDADHNIYLTPGHRGLHPLLDCVLRKAVRSGHLDAAIQIAVIDRTDLYRIHPAIYSLYRTAVTSHTPNHNLFLLNSIICAVHGCGNTAEHRSGQYHTQ